MNAIVPLPSSGASLHLAGEARLQQGSEAVYAATDQEDSSELIQQAGSGDTNVGDTELTVRSFDDFYQSQYNSLVGLGYALTGSRHVAEDLTQDAFTEVHRRWQTVSTYEQPEAWVRRVLINKSHSRGRRLLSEAKMITKVRLRRDLNEPGIRLPDRSSAVWEAVRSLPRRQAEAITLHYWDDLTVAQIADILDIGQESVKTHLKRGRAKLTELVGEDKR